MGANTASVTYREVVGIPGPHHPFNWQALQLSIASIQIFFVFYLAVLLQLGIYLLGLTLHLGVFVCLFVCVCVCVCAYFCV